MRLNKLVMAGVMFTASLVLVGCGNDSNNGVSNNPNKPSTDDEFITAVRVQTDGPNALSDEAEPIDIMSVNATAPDEKEPQAVSF